MVVVRRIGEAGGAAGLVECHLGRQPGLPFEAVGDNGSVRSVKVVAVIGVGLQLAEIGQQLLKIPLVVAHLRPTVVVLGHAPQEHLPVDRTGATGHPAPGHQHFPGGVGGLTHKLPVVVAGHYVNFRGVPELYFLGQPLEIGIVRAGFQQQDRPLWVFGQTGG